MSQGHRFPGRIFSLIVLERRGPSDFRLVRRCRQPPSRTAWSSLRPGHPPEQEIKLVCGGGMGNRFEISCLSGRRRKANSYPLEAGWPSRAPRTRWTMKIPVLTAPVRKAAIAATSARQRFYSRIRFIFCQPLFYRVTPFRSATRFARTDSQGTFSNPSEIVDSRTSRRRWRRPRPSRRRAGGIFRARKRREEYPSRRSLKS